MAEVERSKGSVYQQWHEALLENYIIVFQTEIKKLNSLPTSEFCIPSGDIDDLLEVAKFFEVEIPEDANLKDLRTFKKYLGIIKNKAKKTVLEDLRPTDPYAQVINTLKENDVRAMEGEKV
ncbi:hypothetical protein AciM339_0217 [Aciduliprofundum sp. MAR08-339]|uniref:hypothetical protein n=1 Tax=Aciduliprofundum sp. (strain MAR08-339) TaxID=673860 RepID=UPI0002A4CDFD|nr:hypothetical protein AciM339_0185 [Aciduliprofundum sp. MAR08-339]AGB04114.1 hypothetical protein AciM339_0217 [Aciduliprofundum sp. MAR08-339]